MKNILFNKELKDARACLIENVSEPCFPWRAAFNSYVNYIETLHNYCKEESCELVHEIRLCSELLERKKNRPKFYRNNFCYLEKF